MVRIPLHAVRELAAQLAELAGRQRTAVKRQFLGLYGISDTTLSRALHEVGFRSHERRDRGVRRRPVTPEQLTNLAGIQRASTSLRKGVVMPAADAINIAEDSGLIERGAVTEEYYNEWLRERQASRRDQQQPEPHTTLRSLGPNHVHQVDFSLAVNWKFFQGRPEYEHLIYKNKLPSAGVPRLWRLIVVDHSSGVIFPHYSQSTGETVQATLEGLFYAWSEKRLRGESIARLYPFRGVPKILMADRGSANRAQVTVTILERLGVKLNICEGARSKGSVEVSHNWWEQHFESRLRLQKPESVEQLNEWALDFAVKICAENPHSRHGAARSHMWAWHINRKPESQLRELRCDFETFKAIAVSEPQRCRVYGNRTIRFKSRQYRMPEQIQTGAFVLAQYSPFEFPQILVRDADNPTGFTWACAPVQLDEFGFPVDAPVIGQEFKSHKQTKTARFVKQADEISAGFIEQQKLKVFGHHRHAVDPIEVKHQGADALETQVPEEVRYSRVQARAEVLATLGRPFTRPEVDFLNATFGEAVTESEIAAALAQILNGMPGRVLSFSKTGGF
jgi:hypothetical protein